MIDGIIKGTGNSRKLKSVSNFLSLYPTYADFAAALIAGTLPIDLAGINADGWQQLATALSKGNLLSDETAAKYFASVTGTETVDQVLSLLGRFNRGLGNDYGWEKYKTETVKSVALGGLSEPQTAASDTAITIYYSASVSVSASDTVQLNAPITTMSVPINGTSYRSNLIGKYFYTSLSPSFIWYGYSTSTSSGDYYLKAYKAYVKTQVNKIELQYLNSTDPDAYPPVVPDGYTYNSLGQIGDKVRITAGSYVGTGTFGSGNPNSLVFPFEPKILMLFYHSTDPGSSGVGRLVTSSQYRPAIGSPFLLTTSYVYNSLFGGGNGNVTYAKKSVDGLQVFWYNDGSADDQFNVSNRQYDYLIAG